MDAFGHSLRRGRGSGGVFDFSHRSADSSVRSLGLSGVQGGCSREQWSSYGVSADDSFSLLSLTGGLFGIRSCSGSVVKTGNAATNPGEDVPSNRGGFFGEFVGRDGFVPV